MLKERLAQLVSEACDGEITAAEALSATVPLSYLGVTSLAQMRLIDALEREYDIEIDLADDVTFLDSVDGLAAWVSAAR
ncbi:acyl carrier protein [Planotetraspora kaengkrachanensis]|uniref:Carrier domain-containing protein n=1 Tax=Planotetraspora kaengkrachanensis TaxID=575193 RepID=A0A8J3M4R7_9ACTN|nr:acyl carrier protein [Planotetraspora kaengkrachanensis]GIG79240.1 hypothetical protein Pka01_23670 [Planotetraspora kaengkrachanensis]